MARILVATPAGGGNVTVQYVLSALSMLFHPERLADQERYNVSFQFLANESLIPRGRNYCAQVALTQGWDKLFFIDADCGWNWEDFKKIVSSPHPIIGGACPLKMYPLNLNYMPVKEDGKKYHPEGLKSIEAMENMAKGHGQDEVEVAFLGTAFLCIDRSVLLKLVEHSGTYRYPNPQTGAPMTCWDLFPNAPIANEYMSEDWGFCHLAKTHGYKIMLNTKVLTTHTGSHTFQGQLAHQKIPQGVTNAASPIA